MRRLVPAFVFAVLLHALLLNADPAWLEQRASQAPQPHVITMQLIDRPVDSPPAIRSPAPPPALPPQPVRKPPPPQKTPARVKPVVPKRQAVVHQPTPSPPSIRSAPTPPPAVPPAAAEPTKTARVSDANLSRAITSRASTDADAAMEKTPPAEAAIVMATPRYHDNPPPVYPTVARKRGEEGTVLLEVHVDEAGRVDDLRIATSSGCSLLDRSALKAVRHWWFEPGRRGNRKIAMWVRVPVIFRLHR